MPEIPDIDKIIELAAKDLQKAVDLLHKLKRPHSP